MAIIGIMVLIGVVVNNAIVLVDMINRLRLEGMEHRGHLRSGVQSLPVHSDDHIFHGVRSAAHVGWQ